MGHLDRALLLDFRRSNIRSADPTESGFSVSGEDFTEYECATTTRSDE